MQNLQVNVGPLGLPEEDLEVCPPDTQWSCIKNGYIHFPVTTAWNSEKVTVAVKVAEKRNLACLLLLHRSKSQRPSSTLPLERLQQTTATAQAFRLDVRWVIIWDSEHQSGTALCKFTAESWSTILAGSPIRQKPSPALLCVAINHLCTGDPHNIHIWPSYILELHQRKWRW